MSVSPGTVAEKIYSAKERKIADTRLEQIDAQKLDAFAEAQSIIAATKLPYAVNPGSIADIEKKTTAEATKVGKRCRRNNQHAAYEKEMAKLDEELGLLPA